MFFFSVLRSDRFVILPPREVSAAAPMVEEEVRPRPASLRQQPKRRFSTYVPSSNDMCQQPSTSSASQQQQQQQLQPPISLRFKRISDPIGDLERMPPPKISRISVKKTVPVISRAATASTSTGMPIKTTATAATPIPMPLEEVDLKTLGLIYLCYHCQHQADNFDAIHAHWLKVHKKGEDPTTKRFCYRVTKQVRCVYCVIDGSEDADSTLTYRTIRQHITNKHRNCPYAYAMYHPPNTPKKPIECGQCAKIMPTFADLQMHFAAAHKNLRKFTLSLVDPLPIMNDATISMLQHQGDQGTFKCAYCSCFYSCRYDYEQHHREDHQMIPQKYELNGKDVIKYGCFVCPQTKADELSAIEHVRTHFPIGYQCQYCPTKFKYLSAIVPHHRAVHNADSEVRFKMVCAQDLFTMCMQLVLTFSNGLTLLWGDVMNTKCGGAERVGKLVNDFIEQQHQQQMKAYNEVIKLSPGAGGGASSNMMGGKIGHRRQTLL